MNVGYGMIAFIFLNILISLLALLVTSCVNFCHFVQKNCCKKSKKSAYEVKQILDDISNSSSVNTSNGKPCNQFIESTFRVNKRKSVF